MNKLPTFQRKRGRIGLKLGKNLFILCKCWHFLNIAAILPTNYNDLLASLRKNKEIANKLLDFTNVSKAIRREYQ